MVQPLWRAVWRFLKKLKIELPYDPAIPLLGMHPEKTIIRKDTCTLGTSLVVQWLRICLPSALSSAHQPERLVCSPARAGRAGS